MLITTSKSPSPACRRIARAFFLAVPESALEFRGKRTLSALASKARKKRFARICAIYQQKGMPSQIRFLETGERGWEWLSPHILITKITHAPAHKGSLSQSAGLKIAGSKARALRLLLDQSGKPEEAQSEIISSAGGLSVKLGAKKLLELGVKYEK